MKLILRTVLSLVLVSFLLSCTYGGSISDRDTWPAVADSLAAHTDSWLSRAGSWLLKADSRLSGLAERMEDALEQRQEIQGVSPKKVEYVDVKHKDSLVVYYPKFTSIDLVTGTMPSKSDEAVIFCCEAAFTGELLDEFKHSNIAGHHVSDGQFYKGFKCGPNNGVFTWDSETGWHFYNLSHASSEQVLRAVADRGGMGFCQSLLYHEGNAFKGCFKPQSKNVYRAVCELDGRLCIIDCAWPLPFASFMSGLGALGVKEAIYCDMGYGWNYSWYRKSDGSVKEIFPNPGQYTTNWVTFYCDKSRYKEI